MPTLGDLVGKQSYRGILTGLTDAFLISEEKRNQLIAEDSKAEYVIRPFLQGRNLRAFAKAQTENYVLFLPKGFTKGGMGWEQDAEGKPEEQEAWTWFSTLVKNSFEQSGIKEAFAKFDLV